MKKICRATCCILIIATLSGVIACETHRKLQNSDPISVTELNKQQPNFEYVWCRMKNQFSIPYEEQNPKIQYYVNKYSKQAHHIKKLSVYASPYIYHIVESLERRNLPTELALLPMIESSYKPAALSHKGASGIWQIGWDTGKRYGLQKDYWHDDRRDIQASTKAALDYLAFLGKEFEGDWMLALAAYNCGEGRVRQEIRKNIKQNKQITYWDLSLPKQTREFVPKFLALVQLVKNANNFGIELHPIANKPYFVSIQPQKVLDLHTVANLADIDVKHLQDLNPGITNHIIHPNSTTSLLLPAGQEQIFLKNLASTTNAIDKLTTNTKKYTIKPGDNLSTIARNNGITVELLKLSNGLSSNFIKEGQQLHIPKPSKT